MGKRDSVPTTGEKKKKKKEAVWSMVHDIYFFDFIFVFLINSAIGL